MPAYRLPVGEDEDYIFAFLHEVLGQFFEVFPVARAHYVLAIVKYYEQIFVVKFLYEPEDVLGG